MPLNIKWNRNIDKLEMTNKCARVYCKNGEIYQGKGLIACQGNDKNDEDVDGVLFELENGKDIILIEDEIEKIEFLD